MARMPGFSCGACGYSTPFEMVICPGCGSKAIKPASLSGEGTVYTFTNIRVAPEGFEADAPYVVLAVRLREGTLAPGRWLGRGEPGIGQQVVFAGADDKGFSFSDGGA